MVPRAAQLIEALHLRPHPEGGHFSEVHRSTSRVQPLDERPERAAVTVIYFLLVAGETSRWHRVSSDEVWHYHEGDPLELWSAPEGFDDVGRRLLGQVGDGMRPSHVVPANHWQAARSTGSYTLVACTVGPGFDFADFEMLDSRPASAAALKRRHPALAEMI
jgi:uncharacterized protein